MLRHGLILASSLLVAQAAWAQVPAQAAAAGAPAPESPAKQMARARLMEMAHFLASAEKFSFTLRSGHDALQANGQKIEFGGSRQVAVQRPNLVRIENAGSDGHRELMLFDGRNITLFDAASAVYSQRQQPGDIDATVVHFVRDLKMKMPLAPLLMKAFPVELERRTLSIDYVEHTDILGQHAHHVAGRTATVDFQVWIADGPRPLPLRIVLGYKTEPGHPQFWAQFSDWNLAPEYASGVFDFSAPQGASRIPFAVEALSLAPQPKPASTQGGKK